LITNSKNALTIGDDDDAHLRVGAILQEATDVIAKRIRNKQAAGTPVDVAEFLARQRNHRGINDGQHFFNVVEKKAIEKNLVGVLELAEINVALEIVVLA